MVIKLLMLLALLFQLFIAIAPALCFCVIAYAAKRAADEYCERGQYERDKELVNPKPSFLVRVKRAYRAFQSTA